MLSLSAPPIDMTIENSSDLALSWPGTDITTELSLQFVNWEGLLQYAVRRKAYLDRHGPTDCKLFTKYNKGGRNLVRRIDFEDGTKWVARIPYNFSTAESMDQLLCEVHTMAVIRERSQLPVPEVYGYEASCDNIARIPFILMEFIPGHTIMDSFGGYALHKGQVPTEHKRKLQTAIADIQAQLSAIRFPKLGRIIKSPDGVYSVGPVPGIGGPFDSVADYLVAWAEWVKFPFKEETIRERTPPEYVDEVLESIATFPSRLKKLAPNLDFRSGPFPLIHPDLYISNIIINSQSDITSVIDWESSLVAPWEIVELAKDISTVPPELDGPLYRKTEEKLQKLKEQEEYIQLVSKAEVARGLDNKVSRVLADLRTQKLAQAIWLYEIDGRIGFYGRVLDLEIPFSPEITPEEVKDAILHTGNTSPGADNITVKLLWASWHIIGSHVCRLFQGCLSAGHHPKAFREAEVVMIPKPGKRDLTSARSWRPISLLSCLGKGLERLIARRLAWASVHYGVLHSQQCGALPKRSAVDLVAALIHDIEEAFAKKQVVTLVTMDIQGAFDTVMRKRLALRLREQGWPEHLARWVYSFMNDRSARVRYQDITTASSPLRCGLPQGSPVSPILFLLYTEPIYRLGNPKGRFGYADDTAILCVGDSLEVTAAEANRRIEEKPLKRVPAVRHGDVEKRPEAAMRWLGIWLDQTLSFKKHIEKWVSKAEVVAYHLRSLTNTNTARSQQPYAELLNQPIMVEAIQGSLDQVENTDSENEQMPQAIHESYTFSMEDDTNCGSPSGEPHPASRTTTGSSSPALRCPSQEPRRGSPACLAHSTGRTTGHSSRDQAEIPAATGRFSHPAPQD
ncbi:putative RNA-directed DNA polymerase from transposon BS [Paramyrothecium foliicola]|nr:putative RNA-directed DNA polymerase from transposon BS [Paramyrothecium foliicola]